MRDTSLIRCVLVAALLTSAVAGCDGSSKSKSASQPTRPTASSSNDLQTAYETVVANVLPSVVQITTGAGLGSGVVYDNKGDIVTNAHVVGTAKEFEVTAPTVKPGE